MSIRAVIFDLGGVVLESPLHTIADYEREHDLPAGLLNRVVVESGRTGAWSRLERGEIDMETFCRDFDAECERHGAIYPAAAVMAAIAASSGPRPQMLEALRRLRSAGLTTAALTNNWKSDGQDRHGLRPFFDAFIESSLVGLRKPDPRIYHYALEKIAAQPEQTAFLDDIGANLKAAKALGITTVKVVEPNSALEELEQLVGLELL